MIVRIQDDHDEWISITDLIECEVWLHKQGFCVLPSSISYIDVKLEHERDLTYLTLIIRRFGHFVVEVQKDAPQL